jgi:hypothetical protein
LASENGADEPMLATQQTDFFRERRWRKWRSRSGYTDRIGEEAL